LKFIIDRYFVKNLFLSILLIAGPISLLFSQIGGAGTYRFLELSNSAKVVSLGGAQIAFNDNDLDLTFYNPALLSDSMRNQLSVNYVNYIAGIVAGYAAYAPNLHGRNAFAVGIHYVDYGIFAGASESGQMTGNFGAGEYAINLFYSRTITPQLRVGINLKPIFSSFEKYRSAGLAADFGITFASQDGLSAFSLTAKNFGGQITTYYENGDREKLPWDVQLGLSKQLAHSPLRFFVTANHLNKWNLSYLARQNADAQTNERSENFTSLLMRHFILGAEIYPERHLTLRFGYNYQRQKDLAIENRPGLVGYSAGLGIRIVNFNFNYGIASFHMATTAHYFSLAVNLSQFAR
jgi:hypothetical protein